MAKPELGTKRTCPKCSAKFYDLNKHPAQCPACEHSFDPDIQLKKRGKRKAGKPDDSKSQAIAAQAASKKRPAAADDEDEIDLPEFDDLGIIEEMDDLDDMEEVEGLKGKPTPVEEDEEDEEGFIDDEDIIEDEDGLDEDFDEGDEDER